MNIRPRDFLLIPNLLSLFRLLLMPLPVYCIAQGNNGAALALVALGIVTDVLDGVLARKLNQISELGKLLDPLSDKISVAILVIALAFYRGFPWWAVGLIVGRDLLILIGGIFAVKLRKPIPTSNLFGKLTALVWTLLILSYLMPYPALRLVLLSLAVGMTPISLVFYLMRLVSAPARPSA